MKSLAKALSTLKPKHRTKVPLYDTLPSPTHTRLLVKLTTLGSRMIFTIATIDLNALEELRIRFDALSYTWGSPLSTSQAMQDYSPENSKEITIVSGLRRHTVTVGLNLYQALCRVESRTFLWVDALCINQADLEEKKVHVLLMSDIYSKASTVFIWLGPDDEDTDCILWLHTEMLDAIIALYPANSNIDPRHFTFAHDGGILIQGEQDIHLPRDALTALYKFSAERRYFTRAWIIQEVSLAQQPVILFDKVELPFHRLAALDGRLGNMGHLNDRFKQPGIAALPPYHLHVSQLSSVTSQLKKWNPVMKDRLRMAYGAHDEATAVLAFITHQLTGPAARNATDPRDLIYSLLGMAKTLYPVAVLKPTYSLDVADVFTNFTALVLQQLPSRCILAAVGHKPAHSDYVQHLPSWVPDFATCFSITTGTSVEDKPDLSFSPLQIDGKRLSLNARRCSVIETTFKVIKGAVDDGEAMYQRDIRWILSVLSHCTDDNLEATLRVMSWLAPSDTAQQFEYLCRRLMTLAISGARQYPGLIEPAQILEAYSRFTSPLVPQEDGVKHMERWLDYLQIVSPENRTSGDIRVFFPQLETEEDIKSFMHLQDHRAGPETSDITTFFRTSKHTGRIAADVQAGDEVWLIEQGYWPFVLRPQGDDYILMGEACIWQHEMMDAEEMKWITLI